ncbi:outer membrane beta-barrel protein [Myxacorys almedinensis]|uniref:Outer membrane beta-barrel protein n=1 Tax=Myxacorys almedinensis A TaxID=2690445 RepID=A0A8J8CGS6_9CYAN|nr:outer membrane beta-barrel protein [Myxacorys almedinensis]NDJ15904.1 outer membrane beta-barrel protein [Myxacorys almedinensis A]
MKLSLKSFATLSTVSALVVAPLFMGAGSASAQAVRFDGSYVGGGIAAGVTNGGRDNDAANFGGNIQGRFAVPNAPVSVRGSVLFNDKNSTVIPTLSYDIPLSRNTNVYAGAGYSFVQNDGRPTPLGNKDAAVIQAGVESEVTRGVIIYSDAKYGINAYEGSGAGAVSLQGGVGLRF